MQTSKGEIGIQETFDNLVEVYTSRFNEEHGKGELLKEVTILHRLLKIDHNNKLVTEYLPIIYSKINRSKEG